MIGALRPLTPQHTIFGQYEGYHEVAGVAPGSTTETYAAVRLAVDFWRWADVSTVIRAGKTLPVSATEVNIRFRLAPYDIFGLDRFTANDARRFLIWPETEMGLPLIGKKPGAGWRSEVQELSFAQEPDPTCAPTIG